MAKKETKEAIKIAKDFFVNRKVQWAFTVILFLFILISSVDIRLSNLDKLVDQTTGLYTSNDLDSLYFYRIAETKLTNNGTLPTYDSLRAPGYNTPWLNEILPDLLIFNYKVLKFFDSNIAFDYACAISAPIFFAIGLILFFIMAFLLTKSKTTSLIASAFLGFAPGFLFRSIAGFYDHDHIGVFAIFALIIASYFSLKNYEKNWKYSIITGISIGLFTSLVYISWVGAITFVIVFLPIALFIEYLFNNKNKMNFLIFYVLWIVFSVLFVALFGMDYNGILSRIVDSTGIIVLFVLGFAVVDFIFEFILQKKKVIGEKYEKLCVLLTTAILGVMGLFVIGKNPISLFRKAWAQLIYPFFGEFGGRLGSTVAENSQPYLTDLISQNGKILFWFFLIGLIYLSICFVKNSKNLKHRVILSGSISFIFLGVLFSRYSSSSVFNGENFISQTLYLISALVFVCGFAYVYYREKFKIEREDILLFAIALTVVINARAAIRSFFLITPFICLFASYILKELVQRVKSGGKND